MNWLNKLERKFGRYAVPNLIVYLIGAYSVGFVLNMVAPNILGFLNFQPYYILHGQIWRLITWILMQTELVIETLGGMQHLTLTVTDGYVSNIRADIGEPRLSTKVIRMPVRQWLSELVLAVLLKNVRF